MAQHKFTVQMGQTALENVTVAAGDPEPQTDTVSVNFDATNMTKADAIHQLEAIKAKVMAEPWPPTA